MLPSILCSFRLDVGSDLVPFWLYFGSSSEPFQFHVGSILAPLGVHFESIWGLWRGLVEEKLPSRTEGRRGRRAPAHFKRFWTQKAATRRSKMVPNRTKIVEKSMQKSMLNSAWFLHGLGAVFG